LTVKINRNRGAQQEMFQQKFQKKLYHFHRNLQFMSVR